MDILKGSTIANLGYNGGFGFTYLDNNIVNIVPNKPSYLKDRGIFREEFIIGSHQVVDVVSQGRFQMNKGGFNGTVKPTPNQATTYGILTYTGEKAYIVSQVTGEDLAGRRIPGTTSPMTKEYLVSQNMQKIANRFAVHQEMLRFGALLGKQLDSNGDMVRDYYTDFKLDRQNYTIDIPATQEANLIPILAQIQDTLSENMESGTPINGIEIYLPEAALQKILNNSSISEKYFLNDQRPTIFQDNTATYHGYGITRSIELNGIMFNGYNPFFGASRLLAENEGVAVPIAPDANIFRSVYGSSTHADLVNSPSADLYMFATTNPLDGAATLIAETNSVHINTRPQSTLQLNIT